METTVFLQEINRNLTTSFFSFLGIILLTDQNYWIVGAVIN